MRRRRRDLAEQETKIATSEADKENRVQDPRATPTSQPDKLPVERIVEPAPYACGKCGSQRLHNLGEAVSRTLECEPRRWKIIEHVREKFSCRDCEAVTERPAPLHPIPRLCRVEPTGAGDRSPRRVLNDLSRGTSRPPRTTQYRQWIGRSSADRSSTSTMQHR